MVVVRWFSCWRGQYYPRSRAGVDGKQVGDEPESNVEPKMPTVNSVRTGVAGFWAVSMFVKVSTNWKWACKFHASVRTAACRLYYLCSRR